MIKQEYSVDDTVMLLDIILNNELFKKELGQYIHNQLLFTYILTKIISRINNESYKGINYGLVDKEYVYFEFCNSL